LLTVVLGFFRFLLGGLIMVFGVILPLAYMMFQRNKKGIMFLHKQTYVLLVVVLFET
jgi:hypothetical protein